MRSYAVIPPLMLSSEQMLCFFKNENGALVDMEAEFKVSHVLIKLNSIYLF